MTNQNNSLTVNQKEVSSKVMSRIEEMKNEGLALPANYNPSNALQIAFLKLQDMQVRNQPLLEVVTMKSVYESLLNMTLQGLSPAKNQCYFIPYGQELQMQRSYFGTQAALKRLNGVKDIWAEVIREGEPFEFKNDMGRKRLIKHEQTFATLDNEIVGAYAVIDTEEDGQILDIMTKKQIDNSWSQAKTTNVHRKFPEEMAKRTVINRAAKNYINTSDDSDLLVNAINDTTDNEHDQETRRKDVTEVPSEEKSLNLTEKFKQVKEVPEKEEETPVSVEENEVLDGNFEIVPEALNEKPEEERDEFETQFEPELELNTNWVDYTVPKLQEVLTNHNIPYSKTARKDELVAIADRALNGGGEVVAEQPELF